MAKFLAFSIVVLLPLAIALPTESEEKGRFLGSSLSGAVGAQFGKQTGSEEEHNKKNVGINISTDTGSTKQYSNVGAQLGVAGTKDTVTAQDPVYNPYQPTPYYNTPYYNPYPYNPYNPYVGYDQYLNPYVPTVGVGQVSQPVAAGVVQPQPVGVGRVPGQVGVSAVPSVVQGQYGVAGGVVQGQTVGVGGGYPSVTQGQVVGGVMGQQRVPGVVSQVNQVGVRPGVGVAQGQGLMDYRGVSSSY